MKEERLKENATQRQKIEWLMLCLIHLENGYKVKHKKYGYVEFITDYYATDLIIIHETKKEYVPYDSTTAHLIPCGAWVEHKDGRKYAICKINKDGSVSTTTSTNYILSPTEFKYCNSPVNGDLAGKPFGFEKEVVS